MNITSALWLFPILFMVHNFEEIIMIQPWWRTNRHRPVKGPFAKLATYPPETIATLIAGFFGIFSLITVVSIATDHLIFGLGLALAFGFQLMGHVVDFLRNRRYMPHVITSVITLPYYPWLFVLAVRAGYKPGELILATAGMGIIGFVLLGISHSFSGKISKLLAG